MLSKKQDILKLKKYIIRLASGIIQTHLYILNKIKLKIIYNPEAIRHRISYKNVNVNVLLGYQIFIEVSIP